MAFGWRGAVPAVGVALLAAALGFGVFRRHWDTDRDPAFPIRAAPAAACGRCGPAGPGRAGSHLGALFAGFQLALGSYTVTMLVEESAGPRWPPALVAAVTQAVGIGARIAWGMVADWWRTG